MPLCINRPVFKEMSLATTLELLWNTITNKIQLKNNTTQFQTTGSTANTKRKVLATSASIYYPPRISSSHVIAYKMFLQELWQYKLKCDELLPAHLQQELNQLLQIINILLQQKLYRRFICSNAFNIQIIWIL